MAKLSMHYGSTPDYWLDCQPLENWYMYLGYAEEEAVHQAKILTGMLGAAFAGKSLPKTPRLIITTADDTPDHAAFYRDPNIRKRIIKGPE